MKRYRRNAEVIAKRLASWQALSPIEQLRALDDRLGPGVGAYKQRKRLQKLIDKVATK